MAYEVIEMPASGASKNIKGDRKYTRVFKVITDVPNPDINSIFAAVPILDYDVHPSDPWATCQDKSVAQDEGQVGFYTVTCEYNSAPKDPKKKQGGDNNTPPPSRPPVVTYSGVKYEKILLKDLNNIAVVNTAGMMFDPPVTLPYVNTLISITYYLDNSVFDPSWVKYYTNTINMSSFLCDGMSYDIKTCRINEIKADLEYEQGGSFRKIEVAIEVNSETTWNPVLVQDCGTHELDDAGGPPIPIVSPTTGDTVTKPVPLHLGHPLPSGSGIEYLSFKGYREVSFDPLFGG